MQKKLSDLVNRIEKLDWGYEMSDDYNLYNREHAEMQAIQLELLKLDLVLLQKLIQNLTPYGMSNWQRYFKSYKEQE